MPGVIDAAVVRAGAKTRLKTRILKCTPHCFCRPGFYDFKSITSEVSATPLLDVQVAPGVDEFVGTAT